MNVEKANNSSHQGSKKGKLRTDSIRIRKETKKKIQSELMLLNKKDFGRKITADDFIQLAISLVRPEHTDSLRERTLSNKDRLEQRYLDYCAKNGKISKDEFIGILLGSGNNSCAGLQ